VSGGVRMDLIDLRSAYEDAKDAAMALGGVTDKGVQDAIAAAVTALEGVGRASHIAEAESAIARAEQEIARRNERLKELGARL
jgi:hypothetical protein